MALFDTWLIERLKIDCYEKFKPMLVKEVIGSCDINLIKEFIEKHNINFTHSNYGYDSRVAHDIYRDCCGDMEIFEYLVSKGFRAPTILLNYDISDRQHQEDRIKIYFKYNCEFSAKDEALLTAGLTYNQVYDKFKVIKYQETKNACMSRFILAGNLNEVMKWYFDGADAQSGIKSCFIAAEEESKKLEEGTKSKVLEHFKFLVSKGAKLIRNVDHEEDAPFIHYHIDVIKFLDKHKFYTDFWYTLQYFDEPEKRKKVNAFCKLYGIELH